VFSDRYRVIKNEEVLPGHRLMGLQAPEVARAAVPGQFLHVRCTDTHDPLLRRPISVHYADGDRGEVYILYRVAGKGTGLLSKVRKGDFVEVLGPLGKGFTLPQKGEPAAVLGGGIGIAPLFFLLAQIKKIYGNETAAVSAFLGAATAAAIPALDLIREMGFAVHTATDDGSMGFKGNAVDLLAKVSGGRHPARVYACGPLPMLKSLARALGDHPLAQVSVEEHMGCGVGACLSCICKVKEKGEAYRYAHVCRDGPVFSLRELVL
jgi:dihydroorotate dehydrogenase electron transfer subunit